MIMKKKSGKSTSGSSAAEKTAKKNAAGKKFFRKNKAGKLAEKVEAHTLFERGVLPGEEDPESGHPF